MRAGRRLPGADGAYASIAEGVLTIHGFVGAVDGSVMLRASASGPEEDYEGFGTGAGWQAFGEGAREILEAIRNEQ